MIKQEQYTSMLELFHNGFITQQEWFEYCQEILGEILDRNSDVLLRLKN